MRILRWQNGRWPTYTFSFWIFPEDKMDAGPRILSRWQNGRWFIVHFSILNVSRKWPTYTFSFWMFRDDKMDDGICTLFHLEWFIVIKIVPYTLYKNHTHTTVRNQKNFARCVSVPVFIHKYLFFYFFYFVFSRLGREFEREFFGRDNFDPSV